MAGSGAQRATGAARDDVDGRDVDGRDIDGRDIDDRDAEGRDGVEVLYAERLVPAWWLWPITFGLAAVLAVAYGYAYGVAVGVVIVVAVQAALVAAILATAVVVRVDDRVFRAGRARLPLRYVGRVRALDPQAAALARGRGADVSAYFVLRTWSTSTAVEVEITDPADPHRSWLVSTRHPHAVVAALTAARHAAIGPRPDSDGSDDPSTGEAALPDAGSVPVRQDGGDSPDDALPASGNAGERDDTEG
ncbi:MAG: DUF3093 domain-containing protein [Actinomycetota bacterium]|nr:MAG: DUF3093 domain-containing protein [Actinomycetota bacterium]